ncbi:hypothetical protein [Litorihabitans aurantiacus]|uniref:Uncharacterized protein n=1 Tax=Litorihabitans aurantiacus TaxID=1930061 RepID=A0AA37XFY0_9MICO|nr:hypothetical protein [Litorihabitans aurantiacus]GMA32331.1 hypothetical protein GCM10025875_23230 [Litorihabitans aurantiacus]
MLKKGEWRKLPGRGQRLMARYMLSMPFLQAGTGLLIPISIALILFAKVPTPVALISFLPIVPTIVIVCIEVAGLGEFGRVYDKKIRVRDYLRLVLGTFPYQVFLAMAAVRAVAREVRGERGWEKTEHSGAHIDRVEPETTVTGIEVETSRPAPALSLAGAGATAGPGEPADQTTSTAADRT